MGPGTFSLADYTFSAPSSLNLDVDGSLFALFRWALDLFCLFLRGVDRGPFELS